MWFVLTFRIEEMAMGIVNNSRICCCCCCCCWYFFKVFMFYGRVRYLRWRRDSCCCLLHTPLSQIEEIAPLFDWNVTRKKIKTAGENEDSVRQLFYAVLIFSSCLNFLDFLNCLTVSRDCLLLNKLLSSSPWLISTNRWIFNSTFFASKMITIQILNKHSF
jgi:hypothetical protein